MANQKSGRILRIIFQSVIIGCMLFYGLIYISSATLASSSTIVSMALSLIVLYGALIFFLVRSLSRNMRRWESILYNILNIIFVIAIFIIAKNMLKISDEIFDLENPYDPYLETEAYDAYYEHHQYTNMGSYLSNYLFGFLFTVGTIILSILSMVFSLRKSANHVAELAQPKVVEEVVATQEEKVETKPKATKQRKEENVIKFCYNCGKPIDKGAKFCKYCGKEIK